MGRIEVNRSGEMEVFVRVVELGGVTPAAHAERMTPSAVSKLIARLEARLVNRSTRKLLLTPEGCAFYERATRVLADLTDADGAHVLARALPIFLQRYPGVILDMVQTDIIIDLLAERTDVAIHTGPMKNSSVIARKLGETRMMIVAAPIYFERAGTPTSAADLNGHNRQGETIIMSTIGRVQTSDREALRHLALSGVGLARLAAFTVRDDIEAGDRMLLYVGQGGSVPSRVRALLDFLTDYGKVE